MELWYTDEHTRDVRFSMKVVEQIASRKSAVQQIDILDTQAYGRVLVLDGGLMITEKDEFIYHEMITHVPMAVHPRVRKRIRPPPTPTPTWCACRILGWRH